MSEINWVRKKERKLLYRHGLDEVKSPQKHPSQRVFPRGHHNVKRLLAVHTNVNVLADQRSLSILTVNLSFIVRAGAGRQKQLSLIHI